MNKEFNQAIITLYRAYLKLNHDELDAADTDDLKLLNALVNQAWR